VITYLRDQGHLEMNVDLTPLKYPGVDNLTADITDSGQMFNAMSSYAALEGLEGGKGIKFLLPTAAPIYVIVS
jgi:hypothetical protein